ncbi:MAG: oxygenase MpaB family protein [Chloroflexota bacterium]
MSTRTLEPRMNPAAGAGEVPDPGRYGPGSEAWRLNREAMLLLGAGPRALLLQIAHPAVAAGVADHSDFRTDPWRRLAGTLRSYLTIVYGTTAAANAEIRRLNALHRGIVGTGYSARDPELSLWVHATLVDSTIAVYDAWLEPLSIGRRAAFYAETRPIGRAFGVPEAMLPPDFDAFEAYVASMLGREGPVRVSPVARELAGVVLRPPLAPLATLLPGPTTATAAILDRIPAATYAWTLWPSVGLLPASVRDEYGLAWGVRERAVAAWLVAGWRTWRPLLPAGFRQMPRALAADRRVG